MPTCGTGLVGSLWRRIWFHPAPGTATEKDVIEAEVRENRLCELVDGTLVEKAIGFEESRLAGRLLHLVSSFLDLNDLGICVGADGMMRIAPGLVRIPDLSFITWDRLPGRESPQEPIPDLAPDLAVEVLNEENTKAEMAPEVREYFDAGVSLVWLIDPKKRTARIFSTVEKSILIRADQSLDGGTVLPRLRPPPLRPARPRPPASQRLIATPTTRPSLARASPLPFRLPHADNPRLDRPDQHVAMWPITHTIARSRSRSID